jgi:uncharacterized protein (DUF1015 family)
MAVLHPFRALRPAPEHVEEVACVPYDVIDTSEARALAEGKPLSFLHVIRPEIDLPEGTDEHANEVYEKGAANLRAYAQGEASVEDDAPQLYVYRLIRNGRPQTGLFACVAVADYDDDTILKHELTRPVKEDDRTRHILTQQAHAEPVMLVYRDHDAVAAHIDAAQTADPLYDFTADDGVQHTIWRVLEPARLAADFADVPKLYVADGHHRCKAASRAYHEQAKTAGAGPNDEVAFFPAALFPMSNMDILPYNRVIRELPQRPDAFLAALRERMTVTEGAAPSPAERGHVSLYLDGRWYGLELPESTTSGVADQLDVARLSRHVLDPLLGITNPRTDPNIDFVGGVRGTDALEQRVDSGRAQAAFSMYPTSMEELLAVSDAGELMPPKSTWFEPKLRSGLLVHRF